MPQGKGLGWKWENSDRNKKGTITQLVEELMLTNTACRIPKDVSTIAEELKRPPFYGAISLLMCWTAAILCAFKAGSLSKLDYIGLNDVVFNRFDRFVKMSDQSVGTAMEMANVPKNCFIGFIEDNGGETKLIHAMISTGGGWAAGNKNDCIGLGSAVGWETLNLGALNWDVGNNCILAPGQHSRFRQIKIRYRQL
ncbi:MAG: hypothetical protein ABI169_15695 [Chitinophagaceae bacterium]